MGYIVLPALREPEGAQSQHAGICALVSPRFEKKFATVQTNNVPVLSTNSGSLTARARFHSSSLATTRLGAGDCIKYNIRDIQLHDLLLSLKVLNEPEFRTEKELAEVVKFLSEYVKSDFGKLPLVARKLLSKTLQLEQHPAETVLYGQGDKHELCSKLYIILEGTVELIKNALEPTLVATLRRGESFGDSGLLSPAYLSPCRSTSAVCRTATTVLCLTKAEALNTKGISETYDAIRERRKELLSMFPAFTSGTPEEISKLIPHLREELLEADKSILPGSGNIFFICSGELALKSYRTGSKSPHASDVNLLTLLPWQWFGEEALFSALRTSTVYVQTITPARLLVVHATDLTANVSDDVITGLESLVNLKCSQISGPKRQKKGEQFCMYVHDMPRLQTFLRQHRPGSLSGSKLHQVPRLKNLVRTPPPYTKHGSGKGSVDTWFSNPQPPALPKEDSAGASLRQNLTKDLNSKSVLMKDPMSPVSTNSWLNKPNVTHKV